MCDTPPVIQTTNAAKAPKTNANKAPNRSNNYFREVYNGNQYLVREHSRDVRKWNVIYPNDPQKRKDHGCIEHFIRHYDKNEGYSGIAIADVDAMTRVANTYTWHTRNGCEIEYFAQLSLADAYATDITSDSYYITIKVIRVEEPPRKYCSIS